MNKDLIELENEVIEDFENSGDERSFVFCMILGTLLVIVAMIASGCSMSTGWHVYMGASPIKATKHTQALPYVSDKKAGKLSMLP